MASDPTCESARLRGLRVEYSCALRLSMLEPGGTRTLPDLGWLTRPRGCKADGTNK